MKSIITITMNPAIDKSTSIASLASGKKLRCTPPNFEPGGGGVNVSRAINKLGGATTAIYFAGGYTGIFYKKLLEGENIASVTVKTKNHLRENLIVFDRSSGMQYRFTMPGPHIYEEEWKEILMTIKEHDRADFMVVSGSLPPGVPDDILATIAVIAKRNNTKLIVDSSGKALQNAVAEGVYLVKPNLHELAELTGKNLASMDEVMDAAKTIIDKGKSEIMVVSLGAEGALLVTETIAKHLPAPKVKIKSTVGAGDSMLAGIVHSLSRNKTIEEAVQFGVFCGTAATMNPGTSLCDLKSIESLLSGSK
jgi:6-phosphofructokinase 2